MRSYDQRVRQKLLDGIRRIAQAEALAADAPRPPSVVVSEGTYATYNDPVLTELVAAAMRNALGEDNVVKMPPVMGGEDFGEFSRAGIPSLLYWVGAVRPEVAAQAKATGQPAPSLHSGKFAPDFPTALRVAVTSMVAACLDLLQPKS